VEPKQLPIVHPMTKKRSVSSGLPGRPCCPPADVVRIAGVTPGDVVRRVERVADQHGVAARGVERAVGLVGELVARSTAPQAGGSGVAIRARRSTTSPTEPPAPAGAVPEGEVPPVVAENEGMAVVRDGAGGLRRVRR
jgi:hypothetical protein